MPTNLLPTNCTLKTHVMEHKWTADTRNQCHIHVIEVGERNLIVYKVDETRCKDLSAPVTMYTGVLVRKLLNHLERDCIGLNRPASVDVILNLHKLWDANPRISQFIISMEEAQKKMVQAKLLILDDMLVVFITSRRL